MIKWKGSWPTFVWTRTRELGRKLNRFGRETVVNQCKKVKGDIYNKAVCLIKELIQEHCFASGNGRMVFIATKEFTKSNSGRCRIEDGSKYARVMQGVRENYY